MNYNANIKPDLPMLAMLQTQQIPFPLETARELLASYGSPLYVYKGDRLRETIDFIGHSIPYPRTQFQFASVTPDALMIGAFLMN